MITINRSNYKEEVPRIARLLPRGSKQEIADETKEPYTTVHNVWTGAVYKQDIVDAIVRRYNQVVKSFKPVKA